VSEWVLFEGCGELWWMKMVVRKRRRNGASCVFEVKDDTALALVEVMRAGSGGEIGRTFQQQVSQ